MLATQVNGHGQHSLLMFKPFNFELTGRQQDIAEYAAHRWATAVKDNSGCHSSQPRTGN